MKPGETTQLSSKGQLVLPQRVRKARGWKPGTVFRVKEVPEGILLSPIPSGTPFAPTTVEEVFGIGKSRRRALSVEEMDAVVLAEAARRK